MLKSLDHAEKQCHFGNITFHGELFLAISGTLPALAHDICSLAPSYWISQTFDWVFI